MNRYGSSETFVGNVLRAAPLLITIAISASYYMLKGGDDAFLGASNIPLHPSQNRTLGFADILVAVVPSSTAEHFHHQLNTLSLASHYCGIDLKTFEGGGDKKYTKVWRGQMTMLRHVLEHNLETALILEGAVDWDVRIKDQLTLLSSNLPEATVDHPYGVNWLAFWLGDCGVPTESNVESHVVYDDVTATAGSTQRDATDGASYQRFVHTVQRSGCTVAYAVTQAGANKILDEIGFEHVNLALDRDEVEYYSMSGLAVTPALFAKWDSDNSHSSGSAENYLDRSVRKALYDHA